MQEIFSCLQVADYEYIIDIIGDAAQVDVGKLGQAFRQWREDNTIARRNELDSLLAEAIRLLGGYEIAFQLCFVNFAADGLPFRQILHYTARSLQLKVTLSSTEKELLILLVKQYATKPFRRQEVLARLGAEKEKSKIMTIVLYLGLCLLSESEAAGVCPQA